MGDSEKLSDLPKSLGQYLVGSRRSDPQRHYATPTGPQCPGLCRCLLQEVIVPPQRISYSFSCRSCWWPASAIPRPLLTLTPCPSEALGPQQPAFSVGRHIRRYVLIDRLLQSCSNAQRIWLSMSPGPADLRRAVLESREERWPDPKAPLPTVDHGFPGPSLKQVIKAQNS